MLKRSTLLLCFRGFRCSRRVALASSFASLSFSSSLHDAGLVPLHPALHQLRNIGYQNVDLSESSADDERHDARTLVRMARSCYHSSQDTTDKELQKKLVYRGLVAVGHALTKEPQRSGAHKWHGILLRCKGDFIESKKEKIANDYLVRDAFAKAIEIDPMDPTSQHCLGKWCWKVLQIGWIERQYSTLAFGAPPTSSYEECEKYLLESAKLLPKQAYNCILLGDVYCQQSKYANARKWYSTVFECPHITDLHRSQHKEAREKLARCPEPTHEELIGELDERIEDLLNELPPRTHACKFLRRRLVNDNDLTQAQQDSMLSRLEAACARRGWAFSVAGGVVKPRE